MKWFVGILLLLVCLGCGSKETGAEGLEQDAISQYVSENPNVDDQRTIGLEIEDE